MVVAGDDPTAQIQPEDVNVGDEQVMQRAAVMEPGGKSPSATECTIRVVVADRYLLHRTVLRNVLDATPAVSVNGEAGDSRETCQQARWLKPDVLLVDVNVFGSDLTALDELAAQLPAMQILVVAAAPDHDLLIRALASGARGLMLRSQSQEEVISAIRAASDGQFVVPPQLVSNTVSYFLQERERSKHARALLTKLTPREREVLQLLVEGKGNRAIADKLVISPETAKGHIYSVVRKVDAKSRVEAAALAVRYGLVPVGAERQDGHESKGAGF